jgi:hypothetical protein
MKRTIPVPTNCATSDVLINLWCTCVGAMIHGIHARNNSAMCTILASVILSSYVTSQTTKHTSVHNRQHRRTSACQLTWLRDLSIAGIQFVPWLKHKVAVKTRENRIIRKLVFALPGMAKLVQLLWVRQAAIAPRNCTTLLSHYEQTDPCASYRAGYERSFSGVMSKDYSTTLSANQLWHWIITDRQ